MTCPWCGGPLPAQRPGRGRKLVYCEARCSKAARHARRAPEVLRGEWARANARRAGRRASSRAPAPPRPRTVTAKPWRPATGPTTPEAWPAGVARVLEAARRVGGHGRDPWDLASEVWLRTRGRGSRVRLRGAALDALRADAAQRGVDDRRRAAGPAVRWAGEGVAERLGRRDRAFEAVELRDSLDRALGRLRDPFERVVLRLTVVEGKTLTEAGAVLGVSAARACQVRTGALEKLGAW